MKPRKDKNLIECPFQKLYPSQMKRDDAFFMQLAYNQAIEAWKENEVPVGAIIAYRGEIIASEHNRVERTGDPTAHAEIMALTQASRKIGDWRLNGACLFITKEPCPMCSGAVLMARLSRVVFAVPDPKAGCLGGAANLNLLPELNHHLTIEKGVLGEECRELLQTFFLLRRRKEEAG